MCPRLMKKLGKLFFTTPACTCMALHSKVIGSSHYYGFICLKHMHMHMHMQISYKPVVQAYDDF